ncbi:DUF998 domain-containing protein [Diaminobutyricibacter sp. McL0618]|uniref:DUF998 domain-containing protein n=1 Tax=Leifsonia sp. McL0618 TaxID=3415677 RepID=UPI003CE7A778
MSQPSSIARTLRRPVENAESVESVALLGGAAIFILGALVGTVFFWGRNAAISGPNSLGAFVAIGAGFVALVAFIAGRLLLRSGSARHEHTPILDDLRAGLHVRNRLDVPGAKLHWFDIAALALAHAFIALLGWIGLADLLERSFIGAVVYTLPAAVLAGVALAVSSYVVFLSAVNLTPMLLSLVLALFLVVGALASMLSSSDPHWWKKNLSALGMTDDVSALAFNVTLIIAGVIVTTIAHYATATIPVRTPAEVKGRNRVRFALIVIGVCLTCVGVFPVDRFFLLHNTVATGMTVVYAVMVVGIRWLVPAMPRVFILLGYVFVGVIAVLAVFFAIGYYNLTAVELVAAVLIFGWIIVFLRNTSAMRPAAVTDETGTTDVSHLAGPASAPAEL